LSLLISYTCFDFPEPNFAISSMLTGNELVFHPPKAELAVAAVQVLAFIPNQVIRWQYCSSLTSRKHKRIKASIAYFTLIKLDR
jgi:hypothetical protein